MILKSSQLEEHAVEHIIFANSMQFLMSYEGNKKLLTAYCLLGMQQMSMEVG